jgi:hypothetical protein
MVRWLVVSNPKARWFTKITLGRGSNTTFPVRTAWGTARPESTRKAWTSIPVSPAMLFPEFDRFWMTGIAPSARKMSRATAC